MAGFAGAPQPQFVGIQLGTPTSLQPNSFQSPIASHLASDSLRHHLHDSSYGLHYQQQMMAHQPQAQPSPFVASGSPQHFAQIPSHRQHISNLEADLMDTDNLAFVQPQMGYSLELAPPSEAPHWPSKRMSSSISPEWQHQQQQAIPGSPNHAGTELSGLVRGRGSPTLPEWTGSPDSPFTPLANPNPPQPMPRRKSITQSAFEHGSTADSPNSPADSPVVTPARRRSITITTPDQTGTPPATEATRTDFGLFSVESAGVAPYPSPSHTQRRRSATRTVVLSVGSTWDNNPTVSPSGSGKSTPRSPKGSPRNSPRVSPRSLSLVHNGSSDASFSSGTGHVGLMDDSVLNNAAGGSSGLVRDVVSVRRTVSAPSLRHRLGAQSLGGPPPVSHLAANYSPPTSSTVRQFPINFSQYTASPPATPRSVQHSPSDTPVVPAWSHPSNNFFLPASPSAAVPMPARPITSAWSPVVQDLMEQDDVLNEQLVADWEIREEEIVVEREIARGSYGVVLKGQFRGTDVAIKRMLPNPHRMNDQERSDFRNEILLLQRLRHPNIVLFLGAVLRKFPPHSGPPSPLPGSPQTSNVASPGTYRTELWMVTEYMTGGTLFSLLHNPEVTLSWRQVVDMLIDISKGMCYLHGWRPRPILHRDLKSLNLLCDGTSRIVKISDFGIARPYDTVNYRHLRGSWHWLAPEVYAGDVYSTAADVYSFSIVAWEVCTRQAPFPNDPPESVPFRALQEGRRPEIPPWVPPPLTQLMHAAWAADPNARPSFSAILQQLVAIKTQMEASDAAMGSK